MNKRVDLKSKIIIAVLVFVCCSLLLLNVSLALFGDKRKNTGIVQFAQHKLDVEIVDNDSIILTPEELILGSRTKRTINISNPANSTSCVLRIKLEFYINDELDSNYLNFSISNVAFSLNEENNYYYYNGVLGSGSKIQNLELNFEVNGEASESYQGKPYNIKLYIESIQSTREAVGIWKDQYIPEWYDKVKGSLT